MYVHIWHRQSLLTTSLFHKLYTGGYYLFQVESAVWLPLAFTVWELVNPLSIIIIHPLQHSQLVFLSTSCVVWLLLGLLLFKCSGCCGHVWSFGRVNWISQHSFEFSTQREIGLCEEFYGHSMLCILWFVSHNNRKNTIHLLNALIIHDFLIISAILWLFCRLGNYTVLMLSLKNPHRAHLWLKF